jgi:hypothetical protein
MMTSHEDRHREIAEGPLTLHHAGLAARVGSCPKVAFGPRALGWGSWDWAGADIAESLAGDFETVVFDAWDVPHCDVLVLVKHPPPVGWIEEAAKTTAVIYSPIDRYNSAAEIDADAGLLRRCARVLVHCERLRRYVEPYATTEYMDHHIKFAAPLRREPRLKGDLLWVGVRTNLPPLVAWVNAHPLPDPLEVVTNFADPARPPTAVDLGFDAGIPVRVHDWSPGLQAALTGRAKGVLDVKGDDFRARHKPPAKGIDFVASGVPLAMDAGSSTAEHLARMGFEVASPLDARRWLSGEYAAETIRFGGAIRELLGRERIARRYRRIIDSVLEEHFRER